MVSCLSSLHMVSIITNCDKIQLTHFFLLPVLGYANIQEIITKFHVTKPLDNLFLSAFYSFSSYVEVFDLFGVNFYVQCELGLHLHAFAYR